MFSCIIYFTLCKLLATKINVCCSVISIIFIRQNCCSQSCYIKHYVMHAKWKILACTCPFSCRAFAEVLPHNKINVCCSIYIILFYFTRGDGLNWEVFAQAVDVQRVITVLELFAPDKYRSSSKKQDYSITKSASNKKYFTADYLTSSSNKEVPSVL